MLGGNCLVQERRSVTDLIEYFFDNFGELGQIESVTLWRFLTWLGLNVPLPCMQNEQIKIFLAVNRLTAYDRIGDQEKKETAEKELRKMILNLCGECRDEEISSGLLEVASRYGIIQMVGKREPVYPDGGRTDYFWDDEWEEPITPVVKAEKIYPNDPCPCGSGKKFKKCCKGKGIFD